MKGYKVMIVAGEASGDLHGSYLVQSLRRQNPDIQFFGMGGRLMQEAGVELLFDPTQMSTIGFVEALKSYRVLKRVLSRLRDALVERRPDVLVLIDFGGFNMRLGPMAKAANIPVVYYISPAAWAYAEGRAKKVAAFADKVVSIFPFEYDVYKKAGANVEFVGHPLLDIVQVDGSKAELCSRLDLDPENPIIGLLPGSREQELKSLFPKMLAAARLIAQEIADVQFVVPLASTVSDVAAAILDDLDARDLNLRIVTGEAYSVMAVSDLAVIACGTATLEAAILDTPQVAIYQVAPVTAFIVRRVVRISHFALPNIIMEKEIIPELIQEEVTTDNIAGTVLELWNQPDQIAQIRRDYQAMRTRLGSSGAVDRAAAAVLQAARQSSR
ncbi:MAG: lipid-A-disaccharide synthase [Firmicutes bacterium]|nr:lipid-A-disaccharide synthase [Bacillota bacterium]